MATTPGFTKNQSGTPDTNVREATRQDQNLIDIDWRLAYMSRVLSANSAPVAQLDRVPDYESVGRRFESCRARQLYRGITAIRCDPFFVAGRRRIGNPPPIIGAPIIHETICFYNTYPYRSDLLEEVSDLYGFDSLKFQRERIVVQFRRRERQFGANCQGISPFRQDTPGPMIHNAVPPQQVPKRTRCREILTDKCAPSRRHMISIEA